jgi:hypothetical protein
MSQQAISQKEVTLLNSSPHASLTKLFMSLPDKVIAAIAPDVKKIKSPGQPLQVTRQRKASELQSLDASHPTMPAVPPGSGSLAPAFGPQPAPLVKFNEASSFVNEFKFNFVHSTCHQITFLSQLYLGNRPTGHFY